MVRGGAVAAPDPHGRPRAAHLGAVRPGVPVAPRAVDGCGRKIWQDLKGHECGEQLISEFGQAQRTTDKFPMRIFPYFQELTPHTLLQKRKLTAGIQGAAVGFGGIALQKLSMKINEINMNKLI